MVYKKLTGIAILVAVLAACVSGATFAATDVATNDKIIDSTMQILIFIQKYSWPFVTILFIVALHKFYVEGSEFIEKKIVGQRLIVGIAIFMATVQCLPLFYAFVIIK